MVVCSISHVAIILDGNRRWAKQNNLSAYEGHKAGAKNLERVTKYAINSGIKYLTVYALSTENVKERSKAELSALFSIFDKMADYKTFFKENNVRFNAIGDLASLSSKILEGIEFLKRDTRDYDGLVLSVALNYGGRDEIVRAANKLAGKNIDELSFAAALDTCGLPDVDLVIRTGGCRRLSNFLPWQCAYAELYFTNRLWPEFDDNDFSESLSWYATQKRNFGK